MEIRTPSELMPSEAVGELPEHGEHPLLDTGQLHAHGLGGEPVRALAEPALHHRGEMRPAAHRDGEAPVEDREHARLVDPAR
jgi:hypothetical protein